MTSARADLLAIVGPTASGKTDLGLRLARERDGEIISVDSRQVYRGLSVGTAKPAGRWHRDTYDVDDVSYHLVDFLEPDQSFSAAAFVALAEARIRDIHARGRRPILVGGTGFYFRALFEGLAPLPTAAPAVRAELHALAESKGRPWLHGELSRVDPEAAAKIPANNIHRVVRALEVYRLTGKPISAWHAEHQKTRPSPAYRVEWLGLDPGKEILNERIAERCRRMLGEGMIEETEAALRKGFARGCPGLSGLGYPRVIEFLDKKLTRDALQTALIRDTRQYAKRQRTWFRGQWEIEWKK